ncbi:MAG: hypothetical protein M3Z04_14065 [Chloroflexota bacterium]|nr:hypothetical protein [Chloroflexota bacterium]
MMTPRPPAPPPANEALAVVQQVLGLLWRALRYLGRRTREQPLIGLLYFVTWGPGLLLLGQNAHQAIALKLTTPYHRVEAAWPLTGVPWPPPILLGLVAALIVPLFVDKWAERRMNHLRPPAISAALDALPGVAIPPDVWAVGKVVTRTWQPDPGEWTLAPTPDLFLLGGPHLRVGTLFIGPPGAGKTSLGLEPILYLCEREGWGTVVFDVKGDDVAPGKRPDYDPARHAFDVTIDFTHPARSAKLNIAAGRTPRAIGEAWGEALGFDPSSADQYFVGNARAAAGSLAAVHHRAWGTIPSFRRVLAYLRDPAARKDLATQLRKAGAGAKSDEALDLARIEQLLAAKDTDPLGRLDLALAPLARGEIADLLVTDDSGVRLWDLLNEGKRVRVILPVEKHPYIAPIIGRLVLAQFTAAVLDGTCGPGRHKVALVDEARHFITPTAVGGMAQARANGGCYVMAVQDLAQIADPTLRAQFRAVCGNVVLMPGLDKEDADTYSATFPSGERLFISHSTTSGSSTSRTDSTGSGSHHAGSSRQQSHGNSTASSAASGETRQVRERRDWLAGEIRYLPQGHFLIERRDDRGTMTPPTVVAVSHTLAAACRHDQQIGANLRGAPRPTGLPPIALIPAPTAGVPSSATPAPPAAPPLANPTPTAAPPLLGVAPATARLPLPPAVDPRAAEPNDLALPLPDPPGDEVLDGTYWGQAPSAADDPTQTAPVQEPSTAATERREPSGPSTLQNPASSPPSYHRSPTIPLWRGPRQRSRAVSRRPVPALPQLRATARNQPAPAAVTAAAAPIGPADSRRAPVQATDSSAPGAAAALEWLTELATMISTALQVDQSEAATWITAAVDHHWSAAMVLRLLAEVQADPNITRPAAIFKRRILANKPPVG